MKINQTLIIAALIVPAMAFSQARMTTGEYMQQHPELKGTSAMDPSYFQLKSPVEPGKALLNGATYTYVGYYIGYDGPSWWNNPPCYTGQEAAALLFGGQPSDYAISTNPNTTDPGTITFTARCCAWGVGLGEYPQDYKYDAPPPGYTEPYGFSMAVSAYVQDWPGESTNYVWRITGPEPVPVSNWALLVGIGLILTFTVIRFRKVL
jgi:hypothetical protein